MKPFLSLLATGLILTPVGFLILFASLGRVIPREAIFAGFAMIILGPLLFVSGLAVFALQRPSPQELAGQKMNDQGTWHIRPVGLLIIILAIGGFVVVAQWLEHYLPGINSGRPSLLGLVFALICAALLSWRKVRHTIFYLGEANQAKEVGKTEDPAERIEVAEEIKEIEIGNENQQSN